MDKSQNLPSIDEDALDGVAGGSSAFAVGATALNQARKAAIETPLKIAGLIVGGQLSTIGGSLTAVGDAMSQIGAALSGGAK